MYLERKPVRASKKDRVYWWLGSHSGRCFLVCLVALVWVLAGCLPWQTVDVERYAQGPPLNITAASGSARCWVWADGVCTNDELYSIPGQSEHLEDVYLATFCFLLIGLLLLLGYAGLTWADFSVWSGILGLLAAALLAAAVVFFAVGVDQHNRSKAWGKQSLVGIFGQPALKEEARLNVGWYIAIIAWFLLFAVYVFVACHTPKKRGSW